MASKRHIRRKSCTGKVPFRDQVSAQKAATSYKYAFKQAMTPYKCKFCGAWHMGHPPKKVRQAMNRNGFVP